MESTLKVSIEFLKILESVNVRKNDLTFCYSHSKETFKFIVTNCFCLNIMVFYSLIVRDCYRRNQSHGSIKQGGR